MSAIPTEAERETAAHALGLHSADSAGSFESHARIAGTAQALADQRAKYEAVAHEFDVLAEKLSGPEGRMSYRDAAQRIRRVNQ